MVKPDRLLTAVCTKDARTVGKLLQNPANLVHINHQFKRGTPLHYAISNGKFDTAKLLIESGADINCKNQSGTTPLSLAINSEDTDFIQYMLNHGANAYESIMIDAVCTQDINIVRMIHERVGSAIINEIVHDNYYKTPLYAALTYDTVEQSYEIALYLLNNGASIELVETTKENVFSDWLCSIKHDSNHPNILAIFNKFLEHGFDINRIYESKNKDGTIYGTYTVLHYVDNLMIAQKIFELGFNHLEHKNAREYTPLFWCIEGDYDAAPQLVQLYLSHGADPNTKNNEGQTPLEYLQSMHYFDGHPTDVPNTMTGIVYFSSDLKEQKDKIEEILKGHLTVAAATVATAVA